MILQALTAKITKLLHIQCKSHMQHNCNTTSHAAQPLTLILLTFTTLVRNSIAYTYHMPQIAVRTEVLHPCNALWYLANICSRTSQDCLCNSASNDRRLSFNIAMISRLLRLIRTSSNSGISHSSSTIKVCTNLKTLVTLSSAIIQPMSWSFTASCEDRVLVRLSI